MKAGLRGAILAAALALSGCAGTTMILPAPASSPPPAGSGGLRAGFGRADITPPPGLGLLGDGPEGKRSNGHRHRLYARALVLEDGAGERVALVTTDLGEMSVLLHRLVAERTLPATGLGADRVMLAATHTHSGPGHFFEAARMNDAGASVAGFDSTAANFLADRIARAVIDAARAMRPAAAAWGDTEVWGLTRNRSYGAWLRNRPHPPLLGNPAGLPANLPPEYRAVDPVFTMLRVDTLDAAGVPRPAGAFSVFAIHGTGNSQANDLYDGDIHALVERGLERFIDLLNRDPRPDGPPRAVHLFANGVEGDVSPDFPVEPADRHTPPPRLARISRPAGPRTPRAPLAWVYPDAEVTRYSIDMSRRVVNTIGDSLAVRAIRLYEAIGRDSLSRDLVIGRAFRTLDLRAEHETLGICPEPRAGTAVLAGAEDSYTRYHGWKMLGIIPAGIEEGGSAVAEPYSGCQHPKRVAGGLVGQSLLAGKKGLPWLCPLQLIRVGGTLLGAAPVEMTTVTGARARQAIAAAAAGAGFPPDRVRMIGLANGYLNYMATAEEYAAQNYEGGSTLYGPGSAAMLRTQFARLTGDLLTSGGVADLRPELVKPGPSKRLFPEPSGKEPPARTPPEVLDRPEPTPAGGETDGIVVARWLDADPGDIAPWEGPLIYVEKDTPRGWEIVTWDDDRFLEIRHVGRASAGRHEWEARWSGGTAGARYRFRLAERPWRNVTLPEVAGTPFTVTR